MKHLKNAVLLVLLLAGLTFVDCVLVCGTVTTLAAAFGLTVSGLWRFWLFSLMLRIWLIVWHYEIKEDLK